MAVKDINAKSWALSPSAGGRRHSSGIVPAGGTSALNWEAPEGMSRILDRVGRHCRLAYLAEVSREHSPRPLEG